MHPMSVGAGERGAGRAGSIAPDEDAEQGPARVVVVGRSSAQVRMSAARWAWLCA